MSSEEKVTLSVYVDPIWGKLATVSWLATKELPEGNIWHKVTKFTFKNETLELEYEKEAVK